MAGLAVPIKDVEVVGTAARGTAADAERAIAAAKATQREWAKRGFAERKTPRACDVALYCERNLVERFVNQIKHFRAVATRHDTLAGNFLAGAQLAAVTILLN